MSDFNVFGKPRKVTTARHTLDNTYDARGRLTKIESDGRVISEFIYGKNGCTNGSHCFG